MGRFVVAVGLLMLSGYELSMGHWLMSGLVLVAGLIVWPAEV